MPRLIVSPVTQIDRLVSSHQPSHMITLMTAGAEVSTPPSISPDRHLTLYFNDIDTPRPGLTPISEAQMVTLIEYFRAWDQTSPVLIHCFAGISRSTAASMVGIAALKPDRSANSIAKELRFRSPSATPNKRILALADELIRPLGSLKEAGESIGRGAHAFEGKPFAMPLHDHDDGMI